MAFPITHFFFFFLVIENNNSQDFRTGEDFPELSARLPSWGHLCPRAGMVLICLLPAGLGMSHVCCDPQPP